MNKLKIGQIFRYPKDKVRDKVEIDGFPNFSFYTDALVFRFISE